MAWLLFFQFLLVLAGQCVIATYPNIAGFGMVRNFMNYSNTSGLPDLPPEIKTYYYAQTLDHFNYNPESYTTFQQKYFVNSKYWGGSNSTSNSPIFVFMGDEANITLVASFDGFINEIASHFNGLIVYIEVCKYMDFCYV